MRRLRRGLDSFSGKPRGSGSPAGTALPLEGVILSLQDLIGYFEPPSEELQHEEKQSKLRSLRNRQSLFQEEVRPRPGRAGSVGAGAGSSEGRSLPDPGKQWSERGRGRWRGRRKALAWVNRAGRRVVGDTRGGGALKRVRSGLVGEALVRGGACESKVEPEPEGGGRTCSLSWEDGTG